MSKLKWAAAMLSLLWLTSGCGGGKAIQVELLHHIPADAVGVMSWNLQQIHQKANPEAIKKTPVFQSWTKQATPETAKAMELLLQNPEESGIALGNIYGYSQPRNVPNAREMFNVLLLPLKDKAKWQKFITGVFTHYKIPIEIKSGKDFEYLHYGNNDAYVAWDAKMVVIGGSFSRSVNTLPEIEQVFVAKTTADAQTAGNLSQVPEFMTLDQQKRDFLIWFNPDALIDNVMKTGRAAAEYEGYLNLIGLSSETIKGNHFAIWYDFQNGAIESGMHYRFSPGIQDRFGHFLKNNIESDFAPYLPKEGLAMVQTLGIDTKAFGQFLQQQRMDQAANLWLGQLGTSVNKLAEGLGGDMFSAVHMPSMESLAKGGGMEITLGFSLKKPEVADQFLALVSGLLSMQVSKKADGYQIQIPEMNMPFYAVVANNMLIISSNQAIINQTRQGGFAAAQRADASYMKPLQSGWLGIYFDHRVTAGESIGALGFGLAMSGLTNPAVADILSDYDEMVSSTLVFGKEDSKIKLELKTKDKNSLQRIIELSNDLYGSWAEIQEE